MVHDGGAPPARPHARPLLTMFRHTTLVLALLTIGYYALPMRRPWGEPAGLLRLAVSLLALGGVAWALRRQHLRSREQPAVYLRIQWLLSVLYLLVLAFALAYALVASFTEGQFVGVTDRTAALYFSVTIVATVGFGDVHASGTLGQLLVTAQMLFNLVYLGTALRILSSLRP